MEIEYKKLGLSDIGHLAELLNIYKDEFNLEKNYHFPDNEYLQQLLSNKSVIFYTALESGDIVGGLTAYILPSVYFSQAEVYIYDLAVKSSFQRKGIGTGLIQALKRYCEALGIKEIFVQADQDDHHAVKFYKATGGVEEKVVHFSFPLNVRF